MLASGRRITPSRLTSSGNGRQTLSNKLVTKVIITVAYVQEMGEESQHHVQGMGDENQQSSGVGHLLSEAAGLMIPALVALHG